MEKLPEYLKPVVSFAYTYAWREGEILKLEWRNVDLKNRVIRLEPGTTKNDKGRTIFLNDEMLEMFKTLFAQRRLDTQRVFLREGKPIKDFRKAWLSACEDAKLEGKMFHGLRRTAIRNLVRSGVTETVCMKISGHKTRSVFDRYNITSDRDLQEATQKLSAYIQEQKNPVTGKASGKVIPFEQKEANIIG